jgi:membrane protease YdiL (CAAX protease family)
MELSDPQQALLSVVLLNVLLVFLTLGVFWGGVFVARSSGRKGGYSLAPLGFSRPSGGFLVGIAAGLLVGSGAVVLGAFVTPASAYILDRLGYSSESTVQRTFIRGLESWVRESPGMAIPAIILVVVVVGPAVEELVFRGAVFNGLYRLGHRISSSLGTGGDGSGGGARGAVFAVSALASSAFFALLHLEPVLLPTLLIFAVALCALFARTGSLLPSFVAHATFNSFTTTLIIMSGLGVFELPV